MNKSMSDRVRGFLQSLRIRVWGVGGAVFAGVLLGAVALSMTAPEHKGQGFDPAPVVAMAGLEQSDDLAESKVNPGGPEMDSSFVVTWADAEGEQHHMEVQFAAGYMTSKVAEAMELEDIFDTQGAVKLLQESFTNKMKHSLAASLEGKEAVGADVNSALYDAASQLAYAFTTDGKANFDASKVVKGEMSLGEFADFRLDRALQHMDEMSFKLINPNDVLRDGSLSEDKRAAKMELAGQQLADMSASMAGWLAVDVAADTITFENDEDGMMQFQRDKASMDMVERIGDLAGRLADISRQLEGEASADAGTVTAAWSSWTETMRDVRELADNPMGKAAEAIQKGADKPVGPAMPGKS